MILFFNDPSEDIDYIREALGMEQYTKERLDDALHRILGLKAKLGLNNIKVPGKGRSVSGWM